jgi:hypothetical protein
MRKAKRTKNKTTKKVRQNPKEGPIVNRGINILFILF